MVVFRLKDDAKGNRLYATLLAAKVSESTVTAGVNDTNKDVNGYCYLQYLDIQ